MKFEKESLRNIETNNPEQGSIDAFNPRADEAGPVYSEREIPVATRKLQGFSRPFFVMTGMALCMGLSSCVVPHDSYGGTSATITTSTYRPGYRVTSLPGGYRSETISGSTYYYHDGYYYRQGSGGYVVVDAPRNSRYYDDYGRRHGNQQTSRDGRDGQRYQRTEVITRLPSGYREVNHRGNTYYQVGDRYYRRDKGSYIIVSSPF